MRETFPRLSASTAMTDGEERLAVAGRWRDHLVLAIVST